MMSNCGERVRSRNSTPVSDLRPKVMGHEARLLSNSNLTVRPRVRLAALQPLLGPTLLSSTLPPSSACPVSPLPQRARLLAPRLRSPAWVLPEAREARVATGLRRVDCRAFCKLSHPGDYSHPVDSIVESMPERAVQRASHLRVKLVEDRMSLRVQGGAGGGPEGSGERLRPCISDLGRMPDRRRFHSGRLPRGVPDLQGIHRDRRVGAALSAKARSIRGANPKEKQLPGLVQGRSSTGVGQEPVHRGGGALTQGLLRLGASPAQDPGLAVNSSDGQGSDVHLRVKDQRLSRPPAASPRGPVELAQCVSAILEDNGRLSREVACEELGPKSGLHALRERG